jgi:hypothetical protein
MVDLSDTDVYLEFDFEGAVVLKGTINRIHGPLIVEEIKSRLPWEGRATFLRGEMKITLEIHKGNSKPVSEVKRGEIAYMPLGDSLNIYLKDTRTFSKVNVLGEVISDDATLDALESVRRGARVTIRLANE